jgi:cystathionine beta-lyase/cystathionine gamma-synthase
MWRCKSSSELSTGMQLATELARFGCGADPSTGAVVPPIHLSTTFERDEDLGYSRGHLYQRWGNPTRGLLEESLAKLEGGSVGCAFSSGMAALSSLLQGVAVASKKTRGGGSGRDIGCVLYPSDTYHGLRAVILQVYGPMGLETREVDMSDLGGVEAACAAASADGFGAGKPRGILLLHVETPSNPLLLITDIAGCAAIARRHGAVLSVDSTWMTPVVCQPLRLGAVCCAPEWTYAPPPPACPDARLLLTTVSAISRSTASCTARLSTSEVRGGVGGWAGGGRGTRGVALCPSYRPAAACCFQATATS